MFYLTALDDHKNEDGSWNWSSYKKAQTQTGEVCRDCGATRLFAKGYPARCVQCDTVATDAAECGHYNLIRCPKCRHTMQANDFWESGIHSEGLHEIYCHECEHEFKIETWVSYTFRSPALIEESEAA